VRGVCLQIDVEQRRDLTAFKGSFGRMGVLIFVGFGRCAWRRRMPFDATAGGTDMSTLYEPIDQKAGVSVATTVAKSGQQAWLSTAS